ncbi:hypothetical protein NQ315_003776, partial [Exocentrus adspersus]
KIDGGIKERHCIILTSGNMPGTRCGIYGCNNTYKTNKNGVKYSFHRMPKAKDLVSDTIRKQWIIRCKRKDTFDADNIFICSAHFTKNDFERDLQNELLGRRKRISVRNTKKEILNLLEAAPSSSQDVNRDPDLLETETVTVSNPEPSPESFNAPAIDFEEKKWASKLSLTQGILSDVLLMLKLAGESFSTFEKTVVLQYDEVKVKAVEEYNIAQDE